MRNLVTHIRPWRSLVLLVVLSVQSAWSQLPGAETTPGTEQVTGFVIRWHDDPAEEILAARVASADAVARRQGLRITYVRAAALGRHVLRLDKALAAEKALALGREIAANDKKIQSIEPNGIMRAMPRSPEGAIN